MDKKDTILIGVGGGGCKILNKVDTEIEKLFLDTNKRNVEQYSGLCIGQKFCNGITAAGQVNDGELAVRENRQEILEKADKFSNWIIIAPMGGGTSCGGTKKLVEFGLDNNKSVKVITSIPFDWEGNMRMHRAAEILTYITKLCEVSVLKFDYKKQTGRLSVKDYYNIMDEKFINEISKQLLE